MFDENGRKVRVEDRPKKSVEDLRTRPARLMAKYYARMAEFKAKRRAEKERIKELAKGGG